MNLPRQDAVPLYGYALQCRITTEDPANSFVPDYGKIPTYRSPAGFGIRLDGGSAYGGAVITPYYDSLLVKMTAWGREFRHACQRMDRCLREFRMRGVKTNIPFLENVVNHPVFQAGERDHALAGGDAGAVPVRAAPRPRHQAADVPGRRDRERQPDDRGQAAAAADRHAAGSARTTPSAPPDGTRQIAAASWAPRASPSGRGRQKRLLMTDTTFRDAHQSLLATRVRTYDMLAIANFVAHRLHDLFSLEMWGGATFDVTMRFLHEDPWQRLRRAARGDSEHLLPDAAARVERGGLHGVSGQRGRASSSTRRRRRASTSSASSTRSTGCPT